MRFSVLRTENPQNYNFYTDINKTFWVLPFKGQIELWTVLNQTTKYFWDLRKFPFDGILLSNKSEGLEKRVEMCFPMMQTYFKKEVTVFFEPVIL